MSYQFSYELRPTSIAATVFGEKREGELIGPYVYQMMQNCFRLGKRSILIERHISAQITDQDVVTFMRELSRSEYSALKVAYVDERFSERRPHELGIDVRDYPSAPLRIFASKAHARAWLEGTAIEPDLKPEDRILEAPVLDYALVSELPS